jgi:hypothetical protein
VFSKNQPQLPKKFSSAHLRTLPKPQTPTWNKITQPFTTSHSLQHARNPANNPHITKCKITTPTIVYLTTTTKKQYKLIPTSANNASSHATQTLTSPVNTKHDSQQVVTFSSSTESSSIGTDAQNASSSPPPQLANISPYREDMQHVNSSKQSYNFTDTLTSKLTSSPTISRLNTLPPSFGYPSGVYIFGNASTKGKAFFIEFVYVEEGLILSIAEHGNDRRMSHWRVGESDWRLVINVTSVRNDNFRVATLIAIVLVVCTLETANEISILHWYE